MSATTRVGRQAEEIREALRCWLPGGERLTGVVPLATGHSNQTFILEGLDRVLRLPPPGQGLLPRYDLAAEHAVLASLHATQGAPPVPRVRELCLDLTVLGAPFFIMDRAPGSAFEHPEVPIWLRDGAPSVRDDVCRQWLAAISAVHNLPPAILAMEPLDASADAAQWLLAARRVDAPVELLSLLESLVVNPPPPSGPPAPMHGDPHVANCLWQEGHLTALVDWELAMVGDPLSDLGWMAAYFADEPFGPITAGFDLPGWWTRSHLIDEWEKATGRSADGIRRHEILAMAKISTVFASGAHLVGTGQSADARYVTWSEWLPSYLQLVALRAAQPDRL
ncbi:MAG: phosphotransferase family protein [Acidimicrobiales bacterium]